MATQTWYNPNPIVFRDGDKRDAIHNAFDERDNVLRGSFQGVQDDLDAAIVSASYGIQGAVNTYGDLPDPTTLEERTIYVVRQNAGAPSGDGLYWVQDLGAGNVWAFLDKLNLQDASEVPYDNAASGLAATDVQGAIDEVEGRVDTAEGQIATNTGDIATNAGDIATHVGDTANPHAVTALQAAFTPDTDASWVDPDPTTVEDALNRVANFLAAHAGVPIP